MSVLQSCNTLCSAAFQQRFPCSDGCPLAFCSDTNQTHSVHQHLQSQKVTSRHLKINEPCIAGCVLRLMSQSQRLLLRSKTSASERTDALQLCRVPDKIFMTFVNTHSGDTFTCRPASALQGPYTQRGLVTVPQSETGCAGNAHRRPRAEQLDAPRGNGHFLNLHTNTGRTCLCVIRH